MPLFTEQQIRDWLKEEIDKKLKTLPKEDVKKLLEKYSLRDHRHQGHTSNPINFNDLVGIAKTTSTIPSGVPTQDISSQIQLYVSGSTYTLYIYDYLNGMWHSITLS